MKTRYALLALLPACFVMPNLCASAHSLQDAATSPELAPDRSKPIAIERSIKVPWLNVPKDELPAMSESSAVRMACGGSFIGMSPKVSSPAVVRVRSANFQGVNSAPSPSPTPQPRARTSQRTDNRVIVNPVRSVVTPAVGVVH